MLTITQPAAVLPELSGTSGSANPFPDGELSAELKVWLEAPEVPFEPGGPDTPEPEEPAVPAVPDTPGEPVAPEVPFEP